MFEYNQEIFSKDEDDIENNLGLKLTKSINKIIQNEDYIKHTIYSRNISTDGGNYLSLLKEVDIKGKTANNNKETNLFIKTCKPDDEKSLVSAKELFSNEVFIYTEFAELFNKFQNEFNVPQKEKFNFVKYYDGNDSLLIFDNMIKKGFKICDRFDIPPFKTIELSIKELAKFHAFSWVLKKYRPDFYKDKIQTKKHPYVFDAAGNKFLISICSISLTYLDDEKNKKLKKFLPDIPDKLKNYVQSNTGKAKCLCHADYRMNNLLVKEKNGEADTIIPIDYQAIYYSSPVMDLLYAIFVSTDRQFRKKHLENLKKIYFESLTKFLQYFDIEVESVYTQKDFEEDFKNQLEYGLITALLILPFVLASEDDVPELNATLETVKLHDNFKTRIEEVVDDYIEWGIFDSS